jgi:hypothetical protein
MHSARQVSVIRRVLRSGGALGIVLFVALEPASGQVVTGVLTNRGSDSPVPGAFVLLLDRTDREIVRTATDEEGRFTLRAPAPGEYLLQAERIAWDATPSRSFDLDRDQTRRVDYEATMTPIHLIDLPAGEAGCRMDETPRARVAWGEARKALHAIAWTIGARDYRYRARTFERDLGLDGREVRRESDSVIGGLDQVPYAALDPDALAEEGYVRTGANGSTTYFIPDAAALLDDRFGDIPRHRGNRVAGCRNAGTRSHRFPVPKRPVGHGEPPCPRDHRFPSHPGARLDGAGVAHPDAVPRRRGGLQ